MKKRPELIRQRLTSLKFRLEQAIHAWTIDDYWALLEFYVDILPVIVPAERCTIFILEMGTETIGSMIGTGLQKMRIEPPKDKSIAGKVISTGQAMIANDLDKSYGYHTTVDAETGFVTRNMVCAPIKSLTGHGVTAATMHKRSLERFDFDSVLITYSYILMQNPNTAAEFDLMMELCREREVAVQTIKSVTRRPWGDREKTRATWYEPLEGQEAIDTAVHWVLGNPDVFLISVGDTQILPKVLDAASRFETRPSEEEMQSLLAEQEMEPLFV